MSLKSKHKKYFQNKFLNCYCHHKLHFLQNYFLKIGNLEASVSLAQSIASPPRIQYVVSSNPRATSLRLKPKAYSPFLHSPFHPLANLFITLCTLFYSSYSTLNINPFNRASFYNQVNQLLTFSVVLSLTFQ